MAPLVDSLLIISVISVISYGFPDRDLLLLLHCGEHSSRSYRPSLFVKYLRNCTRYGDVVRVGPDKLHFGEPQAYLDIYNNQNRWDKDHKLYHAFNEDRSSFGFITYKEAKERKDGLNKFFSQRAVLQAQDLIVDKINDLADVFNRLGKQCKSADLSFAYRAMTMDITTNLCIENSVDDIHAQKFEAPILVAMDASSPIFVRFKHSELYKNMIMNCPPIFSRVVSPATVGLVDLQQTLSKQIKGLVDDPATLKQLPHNMTIYHQLISPEAYKAGTVPSAGSLYGEAQALIFAGADTTGNTLMLGTFYLLKSPDMYRKLKVELNSAWLKLAQQPSLRELEQLPYLNAVIKEALRMSSGVISGLLRVVPEGGATFAKQYVPAGAIVSCGFTFVHYNSSTFPNPHEFEPERWLQNPSLDQWLVAFSKGPRSCLGINLAWLELRLSLAHFDRRFYMELEASSPSKLEVSFEQ